MDKITLSIEVSGNVTATFSGDGKLIQDIKRLFESASIPTPYTFDRIQPGDATEHHAAFIIRVIRARNPGAVVEWDKERCEQLQAFRFFSQSLKESRMHRV